MLDDCGERPIISPRGSVLLVEDDFSYRHMLTRLLEQSGYHVTQVADPFHALVILENDPTLQLLLTDIFFGQARPHGFALARMARRLSRSIPVLYMTGTPVEPHAELGTPLGRIIAKGEDPWPVVSEVIRLLDDVAVAA